VTEPTGGVVIVTYNSAEVIGACLESLQSEVSDGAVEVVVVDNGSTDRTIEIINRFTFTRLIRAPYNGGFGYGNNLGAAGAAPPYLMLLNPDARLTPGAVGAMTRFLNENLAAAAVSPVILDAEGRVTISFYRFVSPCVAVQIAVGVHKVLPLNRVNGKLRIVRKAPEEAVEIDRMLGAALMVRRDAFEFIGGFDEGYFLYSEEEDLCKRLAANGGKIIYLPSAKVIHSGGHSAHPDSPLAIASSLFSRQRFLRKHYGGIGASAAKWVWVAALALKFVFLASTFRGSPKRVGYRLAIKSLIINGYYENCLKPRMPSPSEALT